MPEARARLVGINHIALEVGDIDEALEFYGSLFGFELRGRHGGRMAFLDAGDQFVALSAPRADADADAAVAVADADRHVGFVVDDRAAFAAAARAAGVELLPGRGTRFRDPWGNQIEVVQYDEVQFSKTAGVLRGMGLAGLRKTPGTMEELRGKGLAGESE
ncbi:MAG TPA: VOC family protein [Solirubrobacteraceae bacterium]|nr:VOC family protein [Solirubrobacteraceae bacterium]